MYVKMILSKYHDPLWDFDTRGPVAKAKTKDGDRIQHLKIHFTCLLSQFIFQPCLEGGYPLESPGQTRWWWSEQSWLWPSRPTENVHIERNAMWSCDSKGGCNVFGNFIFSPVFPPWCLVWPGRALLSASWAVLLDISPPDKTHMKVENGHFINLRNKWQYGSSSK